MKKGFILFLVLLTSIEFIGCEKENSNQDKNENRNITVTSSADSTEDNNAKLEEIIEEISKKQSIVMATDESCGKIDQLIKKADVIIDVTIESSNTHYEEKSSIMITDYSVKVNKTFKGKCDDSAIVSVYGGKLSYNDIYEYAKKSNTVDTGEFDEIEKLGITEQQKADLYIEQVINGVDNMEVGKSYLLFIKENSLDYAFDNYEYTIVSHNDGYFLKRDQNLYIRTKSDLSSEDYEVNITLDELKKKITFKD